MNKQQRSCRGGIELTQRRRKFCIGNVFVHGDVLEFTFRNIKNSDWVCEKDSVITISLNLVIFYQCNDPF